MRKMEGECGCETLDMPVQNDWHIQSTQHFSQRVPPKEVLDDIHWMQHALWLAKKAEKADEIPVGAVLVWNNEIIGEGWNQPIANADPTAHAEIIALRQAGQQIQNYRLIDTTLYVTLEPCLMCVGAIIHSRIKRLVYAASDPKIGAMKMVFNDPRQNLLNHHLTYESGVLAEESSVLLKNFFKKLRKK